VEGLGPEAYGEAFADVYDEWYADVSDVEGTVAFVAERARLAGGRPVLELGVGTGRLALPLAAALAADGIAVRGLDASTAMVERLRAKPGAEAVDVVVADMADVAAAVAHRWPVAPASAPGAERARGEQARGEQARGEQAGAGRAGSDPGGTDRAMDAPAPTGALVPPGGAAHGVVFVAFNTLFNLTAVEAQRRCLAGVAEVLAPDGCLVVEAFVPAESPDRRDAVTVRSLTADRVVLSVSRADPDAQRLDGQFVDLVDGAPVRLRPWSLRYAPPAELDALAATVGLALAERWGGWRGEPFTDDSDLHVSVYRRAGA